MRYLFLILTLAVLGSCRKQDHEAPELTLLGNDTVVQWLPSTAGNGYYLDAGCLARDNEDGDLTANILVVNLVNPNRKGTYAVTYTVEDEAGNMTQANRIVYIVNAAENFSGNYANCRDTCQSSNISYAASVLTSDTVNRLVRLINFSNYGNFIWTSMTDSTLSVPLNQYLDSNSVRFINQVFTPPSTILDAQAPTRFRIRYSWSDGVNSDTCTAWFQR